jgi:predicted dehydrogenase
MEEIMAKLYTVAIIGCGGRGSDSYGYLINLDKEHFKIVSLCDIRQEWLERAGRNFDVPTENQFLTEEEFFQKKRADILLVTTPDNCHVRHALKALSSVMIFCWKSLSPTTAKNANNSSRRKRNTEKRRSFVTFCVTHLHS